MEGFRSKSCRNPDGFIHSYTSHGGQHPSSMQDLRCYSANHAYGSHYQQPQQENNSNSKASKSKSVRGGGSGPISSSSAKAGWGLMGDPELKRKKRVASYNVYAVEGKMKGSIKKSFRWIKATCSNVYGGSGSSSWW